MEENKQIAATTVCESPLKLDYKLQTPEERNELVKKIIEQTPSERLTPKYLQILADYIIFAMSRKERREHNITTQNRKLTLDKHETSFEGLAEKFENGEDGVYGMIIENDKNIIFTPKLTITDQDIETIPGLKDLRDAIEVVKKQEQTATGKRRYLLKKQLIEMYKDQYVLKSNYQKTIPYAAAGRSFATMSWDQRTQVKDMETVVPHGINFINPTVVESILCNYSKIKMDSWDKISSDAKWALLDLENLIDQALADYPMYYDLVVYKIDGMTNEDIKAKLKEDYGSSHSIEYISALWRKKIPALIAEQAKEDYLTWYYTYKEKGKWKKCSRCGQIKLANNIFFSKNNTSKDGLYSICKKCRSCKKKQLKRTGKVNGRNR